MTRPNCRYCDGTGTRYVPNGPEDFEKEVCDCFSFPPSVAELAEYLGFSTGIYGL
jgi:hypothetical protein